MKNNSSLFILVLMTSRLVIMAAAGVLTRLKKCYAPYTIPCSESEEYKKYHGFDLRGIFLHRLWRTLEFTLAIISHMASYLRLWALSFAHTLLSDLIWQETLRRHALRDFSPYGFWKVYFVFAIWALVTIFFLIIMDTLAVVVHGLRLHWIEFMSQFFKGDGVLFKPFTLSTVLDEPDAKCEEESTIVCRLRRARDAGDI